MTALETILAIVIASSAWLFIGLSLGQRWESERAARLRYNYDWLGKPGWLTEARRRGIPFEKTKSLDDRLHDLNNSEAHK